MFLILTSSTLTLKCFIVLSQGRCIFSFKLDMKSQRIGNVISDLFQILRTSGVEMTLDFLLFLLQRFLFPLCVTAWLWISMYLHYFRFNFAKILQIFTLQGFFSLILIGLLIAFILKYCYLITEEFGRKVFENRRDWVP